MTVYTVPQRDDSPADKILKLLRQRGACVIKEMVELLGVTQTAVRQQLAALIAQGLVTASSVGDGRGRPPSTYRLSEKGKGLSTRLPDRLALVLLEEVLTLDAAGGASQAPQNLLPRLSLRMSHHYAEQMRGDTVAERLQQWVDWLEQHGIVCEVAEDAEVYVLTEYGCPYYGLAQQHREVCRCETEALEHALGTPVTLLQSQLDGSQGCQFRMRKTQYLPQHDGT
jgi:predicted ArsR family transcriptional regulator